MKREIIPQQYHSWRDDAVIALFKHSNAASLALLFSSSLLHLIPQALQCLKSWGTAYKCNWIANENFFLESYLGTKGAFAPHRSVISVATPVTAPAARAYRGTFNLTMISIPSYWVEECLTIHRWCWKVTGIAVVGVVVSSKFHRRISSILRNIHVIEMVPHHLLRPRSMKIVSLKPPMVI